MMNLIKLISLITLMIKISGLQASYEGRCAKWNSTRDSVSTRNPVHSEGYGKKRY